MGNHDDAFSRFQARDIFEDRARRIQVGVAVLPVGFQVRAFSPLVPGIDEDQALRGAVVVDRFLAGMLQPFRVLSGEAL
jgi:hypothetical protein